MSENKEQVKAQANEQESRVIVPPQVELEQYRYADMIITCKCGHDTILKHPQFTNVEVALQLPPFTTDNRQFLGLSCEKCKSALTLRMQKAVTPPAFGFNIEGFGASTKNELTWEAGDSAISYNIYLGEIEDIELEEGETKKEAGLKLVGTSTKPNFVLELEEGKDYRYRVDTIYEERMYPSQVTFISTNEKPSEDKKDEAAPQIEVTQKD